MPPSLFPPLLPSNTGANTQLLRARPSAPNMDPLSSPPVDMAQATVSFLVLPAEVRHMIYHYLFPEGRSAVQLLKRNAGKGYISMSDRLGMIATCRQIYREATGVLQEQNRLVIVKPETFRQLVQKLWIEIYYDSDDDECFDYHILQHLIPLQGIHLHYDLDNRTLIRNAPEIMYADRWLREMCIMDPAGAHITTLLRTTTAKSAFGRFPGITVLGHRWTRINFSLG